jgi:hypothetical protein
MTTPNSTPEKQNTPPAAPDFEGNHPSPPDAMGFFDRVRRELKLNSEQEPVHPTEAAEIVIMEEDADGN